MTVTVSMHVRADDPEWWVKAKLRGVKSPCPICFATGKRKSGYPMNTAFIGALVADPPLPCYQCRGTGDESVGVVGRTSLR